MNQAMSVTPPLGAQEAAPRRRRALAPLEPVSARARVALGVGYSLGQRGGAEATTITIAQMPAHTHTLIATTAPATHTTPTAGALLAQTQNGGLYTTASATEVEMTTLPSGGSQPVDIRDPSLAITWCVSGFGVDPPAN